MSCRYLPSSEEEQPEVCTLLAQHRAALGRGHSGGICRIQVRRQHAWQDAMAFYRQERTTSELAKEPKVSLGRSDPGVEVPWGRSAPWGRSDPGVEVPWGRSAPWGRSDPGVEVTLG